jgi:SpoVK/Ycf46/Vps4 family AAA+-type ATPase
MRPGRLDKILYVGPPDLAGREEILRIRTREMTIGPGVDFQELAMMVCILVQLGMVSDSRVVDGRMFGSRVDGSLPRSSNDRNARRCTRAIRIQGTFLNSCTKSSSRNHSCSHRKVPTVERKQRTLRHLKSVILKFTQE